MLRIGLTGSIATGKTTALQSFAALGIPVYSADTAVHELYAGEAVAAIETSFPGVAVDGRVDRTLLTAELARDPGRIGELEALVHPLVREKLLGFFEDADARGADLAVVEIPLLFETGSRYPLDAVVVTHCTPELQRSRALARPGMSAEKLDLIVQRQMSQSDKLARADHAIDTSGAPEETHRQVAALVETLRARGAAS